MQNNGTTTFMFDSRTHETSRTVRGATGVTLQHHLMFLPTKSDAPTSPNAAPATERDSPRSPHSAPAKKSHSNITECCACHQKSQYNA